MATIEQINQMKQQGFSDDQIIKGLQEQGVSPKEINEALNQSEVKAAVSPEEQVMSAEMQPSVMQPPANQAPVSPPVPQGMQEFPQQGMQPLTPQTQEVQSMPPESAAAYPDYGQDQYTQDQYAQQYEYPVAADTETITEIAQQVIDEKLEKTKKQIQNLEKFKTEVKGRIIDLDSRLTRIEKSIDLLQTSILGKIGEYWKNVSDLKDEMQATQDSFSKVLSPLSDEMDKLREIAGESTGKKAGRKKSMTKTEKRRGRPRAKSKKGEDGFENFLR